MPLGLALTLLIATHLTTAALVAHRLSRPAPAARRPGPTPLITLLRPVTGDDPMEAETLLSSFRQDWPRMELIFCLPSDHDPALPRLQAMITAHPGVHARILTGQVPRTGNPKLDNLWKGWAAAKGEFVAMADSNLLLPRDYLTTLHGLWRADCGLVTSPPAGTAPLGFAAHLEAAFLNTNQARLQLGADMAGHGFAQGKTLFWRRDWLQAQGGLSALAGYLAEDVAATHLVRSKGLKVRLAPRPFAQPLGRRTFRAVWDRQLRWSRVRRDGFPALFALEPLNGAVLPAALMALAAPAFLPPMLVLWYGAEVALARRAGWPMGWQDALALPLRDALLPALWLATFVRRGITWRGNAMQPPAPDMGAPSHHSAEVEARPL